MRIKKDDTVIVIRGKDRGKTGKVLMTFPRENRVLVEGINMQTKHQKPMGPNVQGGLIEREGPIDVSNVMFYDKVSGKGTRVGYRFEDGKKVRFNKKSGETIK